jgi:hypothetical protein
MRSLAETQGRAAIGNDVAGARVVARMRIHIADVVTPPLVLAAIALVAWPRDREPVYTLCVPQYHVAIAEPAPAMPQPAPSARVRVEELPFDRTMLTKDMPIRGDLVRGVRWRDRNGDNLTVFSISPTSMFAVHYARDVDGQVRRLRLVQEHGYECTDDDGRRFHASHLVSDLDEDGVGELMFGYFHGACRTDMSAADFKLFLLEGGDKHVLRGRAWMDALDAPSPVPAAPNMPAPFARQLQRFWPWLSNEMHSGLTL